MILMTPMATTSTSRFRRRRAAPSVETLEEQIGGLVNQRQQLRERGAAADALERNRVRLARAQWDLSHALISRYLPAEQHAA